MKNVGHIGRLVIVAEGPVAKGVRFIVAITGLAAEQAVQHADHFEKRIQELKEEVEANKDSFDDRKKYKELYDELKVLNEVSFFRGHPKIGIFTG